LLGSNFSIQTPRFTGFFNFLHILPKASPCIRCPPLVTSLPRALCARLGTPVSGKGTWPPKTSAGRPGKASSEVAQDVARRSVRLQIRRNHAGIGAGAPPQLPNLRQRNPPA